MFKMWWAHRSKKVPICFLYKVRSKTFIDYETIKLSKSKLKYKTVLRLMLYAQA